MKPQPTAERGTNPEQWPRAVARTDGALEKLDLWHRVTMNQDGVRATSCKEAAAVRNRIGKTGIPLWDEMKTWAGSVGTGDARQYVMLHCRGDRELDFSRIDAAFEGQRPERLSDQELAELDMAYGLVNPFQSSDKQHFIHIFDEDLLQPLEPFGTVMTNAGDAAWGVEFKAHELYGVLSGVRPREVRAQTITADDPDMAQRRQWVTDPPKIGIITGNDSRSGDFLRNSVEGIINERLGNDGRGDFNMPDWDTVSRKILGGTMQMRDRHSDILPVVQNATKQLCIMGARVIAIACNTTPVFRNEIRAITDSHEATFVSMPEIAAQQLRDDISHLDFVAASPVLKLDEWSAYTPLMQGRCYSAGSVNRIVTVVARAYAKGERFKKNPDC